MTFSRRSMYFTSMILTIISLLLFSTFSYLISTSMSGGQEGVGSLQVGSLLSSCLLVISVQLGVQTLPLLLSGELFPADVRATCKVVTFQNLNISPSTISESFSVKEVVHNYSPVKSPIQVFFAYKYETRLPASRSSSVEPVGCFSFFHPKVKVKETIFLRSTSL